MDLSSLGLDEDTQVKILELHESDVSGLKGKVIELLGKVSSSKLIQEEYEAFKAEAIPAPSTGNAMRSKKSRASSPPIPVPTHVGQAHTDSQPFMRRECHSCASLQFA